jgi:hypothetical protein
MEPFLLHGHMWLHHWLKAPGLDAPREVTLRAYPWEALANINDYVAEGFKTGKFAAVAVAEPRALILEDKQLARRLVTQDETTHNKEYCCLTVIKRAIVENEPETAAKIARAFRHAREWAGQHPRQAVLAAQAAGYYGTAVSVEASVKAVECCLSFSTQLDVAQALEGAFATRIESGAIKTESRRRSWRVCTIGNSDKQLPDGDRSNCTSSDRLKFVRNCLGRQQPRLASRITFGRLASCCTRVQRGRRRTRGGRPRARS